MDVRTFELVGNLLPQAMLLVEPSGMVRAANRWAAASLALVDGELAGHDLADFSGDRAGSLRAFLSACAPGREPRIGRLRLRSRDGRLRAYIAFGAALPAADVAAAPLVLLSLAESTLADGGDLHEPSQPEELRRRLDAARRNLEEQRRIRLRLHDLHLRITMGSQPPWQPDEPCLQLAEEARWRHEFAEEIGRIREATLRDELTGLANRTLFHDRLDRAAAVARREGGRVGVLMIDLDGFKAVNDRFGHHAGDAALRMVADRLGSTVRDADTVARLGGDEFAVLLETGADPTGAETVAAKIAQVLGLPFTADGRAFGLRASVGWAFFPDDGANGEAVLRRADAAMYRAKRDRNAPLWDHVNGHVAADHGGPQAGHAGLV